MVEDRLKYLLFVTLTPSPQRESPPASSPGTSVVRRESAWGRLVCERRDQPGGIKLSEHWWSELPGEPQGTWSGWVFSVIYLFVWLCLVLVVAHGIFRCGVWLLSSCGVQALERRLSTCFMELSCSTSRGILVPRPGTKPSPLHWKADS